MTVILNAIKIMLKWQSSVSIEDIHKYTNCVYPKIYEVLLNNKKYLHINGGKITHIVLDDVVKREAFNNGKWYHTYLDEDKYVLSFHGHKEYRESVEEEVSTTWEDAVGKIHIRYNPVDIDWYGNKVSRKRVVAIDENIAKLEALGCVREDLWKVPEGLWKE